MTDPFGTPTPVPLGVPVKKRAKWPLVVGVAVVLALMGACAWVTYLLSTSLGDTFDAAYEPTIGPSFVWTDGAPLVKWSGSGRYAVIQYFDEQKLPVVVVWDAQTDTTRQQAGYVVAAVESAGAQVWLEPVDRVEDVYDSFVDPIDHRPQQLYAWRLDVVDGLQEVPAAKWRAWPGPGAYTAYLEIDPLKGCLPARLLINNNEGSGEGVKAALPDSTATFAPVGWSPSGEFFAIEELLDGEAVGLLGDQAGLSEPEQPDRRLLVFSATTGALVAEAVLPKGSLVAPAALWGDDDTLYWADMDASQASYEGFGSPRIMSLTADGVSADVRITDPELFSATWSLTPLGSDGEGALFLSDEGRLWLLGAGGLSHAGNLPTAAYATTGSWEPAGGLLVSRAQYVSGDESGDITAPVVDLFDKHGANERRIWRGPDIEIDYGTVF